jgi:large subunit ribosomal protein L30
MEKMLKITQIRSGIGKLIAQKRTIKALGIKKMNASVVQKDSPAIRGMIRAISHLVKVEEVSVADGIREIKTETPTVVVEAKIETPEVAEAQTPATGIEEA